jgi:hypothetical protein
MSQFTLQNGVENMNYTEAPRDNAEVLRLLLEQDSLGAESSLWLRAFRQLTKDGKPIGQILLFTIPIGNERKMPIGLLTLTENNRLIFWPVLPRGNCAVINKPRFAPPDHITVESPSEKMHLTSYRADGRPVHVRESWRSARLQTTDLSLLFTFLVRMIVVADQDVLVCRKFPMPKNDNVRRKAEFSRCMNMVEVLYLPIPGTAPEKQYVAFSLYRTSDLMASQSLPTSLLPMSNMHGMVNDLPEKTEFPITVAQFTIRNQTFCLAAGFPPGHLNDALCFGLPRRCGNREREQRDI